MHKSLWWLYCRMTRTKHDATDVLQNDFENNTEIYVVDDV